MNITPVKLVDWNSDMQKFLKDLYYTELAFYRRYHRNGTNWLIHQYCIPLEWLSWLIFCFNFFEPTLLVFFIVVYYRLIATPASNRAACTLLLLSGVAKLVSLSMSLNNSLIISGFMQINSWFVQVMIGHKFYENNSPGMFKKISLNSIVLSLLMTFESRT